jgi:hypothetical protein
MRRAWVRENVFWNRLTLVFLATAGCVAFARAQESPKPQASTARTIILPQRVVVGAPATLGVLDAGGRLTSNAEVELSTGQKLVTDETGRAGFVAPSEEGTLTAKVLGQETTALATVVVAPKSTWPSPVEGSLSQSQPAFSIPRVLTLHDLFTIDGEGFNGRADANHVRLADQPCLIVASSPLSLVVLPGLHIPIGKVALRVNADRRDLGTFHVAAVLLEFIGPAHAPNAGTQSKLTLQVRGTTERLDVEVRNGSPEIIQFTHGNVQRLRTSGGEQNIAPVDLRLLMAGNYSVTARLISSESETPDMEAVRQKLFEARKVASGDWNSRIDSVIARIHQPPLDVARIRADVKQMLDDKPTGQLANFLDAAWRMLN